MSYHNRLVVIVPSSAASVAENAAAMIEPDKSCVGPWFTVQLSQTGAAPVTHVALYTSATDDMVSAMASALPQISGAMFWRHDLSGSLVSSNVTDPSGQPWGWSESLAAAGLKQISSPLPE